MDHRQYVRIEALVSMFKNPRIVLQEIVADSEYRQALKDRFPIGFAREYGREALFGIVFELDEDAPQGLAKVTYSNATT